MKWIGLVTVFICGCLLLFVTKDFPAWGDPSSPASTHLSTHFIEKGLQETGAPNLVTAVLADYRGYDTLFEAVVVFCAGLALLLLLRDSQSKRQQSVYYRHIPTEVTLHIKDPSKAPRESRDLERIDTLWVPFDIILKTVCRILIPFIQIFALYVVAHGETSPGGGFQGGVIFGASLILLSLSFDLRSVLKNINEIWLGFISALGIFIYTGIGVLCMFLGGNFLDYERLSLILPVDTTHVRALGMMGVEIGVGFIVMAVMVMIYLNLSSDGRLDEGL